MKDFDKIDWSKYKLEIKCRGCSESLQLDDITEFQGELKKRTKADIEKVVTSIYKYGFSFPFFIWQKEDEAGIPETNYCLDGHGRTQGLRWLRDKGVFIPSLPVVFIEAKDEDEAKQKLLRLNSQYGQMTVESVIEFAGEIELDETELSLPPGTIQMSEDEEAGDGEELYTKKINAPVYEITGENPSESELLDDAKYKKLSDEINKANIPEEIKVFLRNASTRHIVFNYHKIAEYYAHASREVQELMEKSALVIIDFDKAIENGYVELSSEIIEEYKEEYANEQ